MQETKPPAPCKQGSQCRALSSSSSTDESKIRQDTPWISSMIRAWLYYQPCMGEEKAHRESRLWMLDTCPAPSSAQPLAHGQQSMWTHMISRSDQKRQRKCKYRSRKRPEPWTVCSIHLCNLECRFIMMYLCNDSLGVVAEHTSCGPFGVRMAAKNRLCQNEDQEQPVFQVMMNTEVVINASVIKARMRSTEIRLMISCTRTPFELKARVNIELKQDKQQTLES